MESKKFVISSQIGSLDELVKQERIFFAPNGNDGTERLYHCGWFMSWPFRVAEIYIRKGWLYYAKKG